MGFETTQYSEDQRRNSKIDSNSQWIVRTIKYIKKGPQHMRSKGSTPQKRNLTEATAQTERSRHLS